MKRIKQVWVPYWEWEDWKAGMWRKESKDNEAHMLPLAIEFTGDWVKYGTAMEEVIEKWPRTMLNSLTNPSINKRAFVGHCAVQYTLNIPEYITRIAWKELSDQQRTDADAIAQIFIDEWLERYAREH